MKYDFDQINHLIRHRRSVFPHQFSKDQHVSVEILTQALENAIWAPTHAKTQPWDFVVFSGEKKRELGEINAKYYQASAAENFSQPKYEKLKAITLQADFVIAIVMRRQPSEKIPEMEEIAAVACAVQNLHLTLCAYGCGGYWSTGGITYLDIAHELFGMDPKDKLMGFFYVGVPEGPVPDGVREPLAKKVTWLK